MTDKKILEEIVNGAVRPIYYQTLFEKLNLSEKEDFHSNFLSYLLDQNGLTTKGWFLTELLKIISLNFEWLSDKALNWTFPPDVKREVQKNDGRTDILITFQNGYKLIIENKIKSSEHNDQCLRYLNDYNINKPEDGLLLFLTVNGIWPNSCDPKMYKQLIYPLNYWKIYDLLNLGINFEIDKRSITLIKEYIDTILNLYGGNMRQEKPIIDETTELIIKEFPKINSNIEKAIKSSRAIVEWVWGRIEQELIDLSKETSFHHLQWDIHLYLEKKTG